MRGGGWDTARSVLFYLTREWEGVMTSASFSQQRCSTPNCLCDSWVAELCHLQVLSRHKQLEDGVSDFTVCSVILVAWWHIWHQQVISLFILMLTWETCRQCLRPHLLTCAAKKKTKMFQSMWRHMQVVHALASDWGFHIRAVDLCMQTVDLCREWTRNTLKFFQKEWWMIWQSWGCIVTEARAGVCSKIFNKVNKAIAVHNRVDLNEVLHFRENKQI